MLIFVLAMLPIWILLVFLSLFLKSTDNYILLLACVHIANQFNRALISDTSSICSKAAFGCQILDPLIQITWRL